MYRYLIMISLSLIGMYVGFFKNLFEIMLFSFVLCTIGNINLIFTAPKKSIFNGDEPMLSVGFWGIMAIITSIMSLVAAMSLRETQLYVATIWMFLSGLNILGLEFKTKTPIQVEESKPDASLVEYIK